MVSVMLNYQKLALEKVREYAKRDCTKHYNYLEQVCRSFDIAVNVLIERVLQSPITINFHPDRFANNGKTVLENLIGQGLYHGQFRTGTTNGGKTAYIGGERYLWEQQLFRDAYPDNSLDRPKYGALNVFRYIDGASVRFGSCYFVMKQEISNRCTFSYGDSSINPTTLCTSDVFIGILADLLSDVQNKARMLNQVVSSQQEALAILLNKCDTMKNIGRNLDYCIETHIHGDVSLLEDVESFYVDSSFQNTIVEGQAEELCQKYGINLEWIPKRQVLVKEMGELFRGSMIPVVAKKIDCLFGNHQGIINANLIGQASRDSVMNPENWNEIGNGTDVFQYLKQLWHTVGYFG